MSSSQSPSRNSLVSTFHNTATTNPKSHPTTGPLSSQFEPRTLASQIQEWIAMGNERHGKLKGNASLYVHQAQNTTPIFYQRNINRVLTYNEHRQTGKPLPTPNQRRPRLTKIDEICERLQLTWDQEPDEPRLALDLAELRVRRVEDGATDISHYIQRKPYSVPFNCRAELVLYHESTQDITQEKKLQEVRRWNTTCRMAIDPQNSHFVKIRMEEPFYIDASDFLVQSTTDSNLRKFGEIFTARIMIIPLDRTAVWPPLFLKDSEMETSVPNPQLAKRRQPKGQSSDSTQTLKTVYSIGNPPEWKNRHGALVAVIETFPKCPPRGSKIPVQFVHRGRNWEVFGDQELYLTVRAGWNKSFDVFKPMLRKPAHDSTPSIPDSPGEAEVCEVHYSCRDVDNDGDIITTEFNHTEDGFRCGFCQLKFFASQRLCFHLVSVHDRFDFRFYKFLETDKAFLEVIVDLSSRMGDFGDDMKLQKGEQEYWAIPSEPFDIERFISGNWGWGPFTASVEKFTRGLWIREPTPVSTPEIEASPTPLETELGTPNQTEQEEDKLTAVAKTKVLPFDLRTVKDLPARKKRMSKVPKAYHKWDSKVFVRSKTKRFLEEGEIVSESDDDVDEEWLKDAHDAVIDDFTDISTSEKALIKLWDRHIFEERPTAQRFLPSVLVRFVRKHREQLAETELLVEFWKLGLSLIQYNAIEASHLTECMRFIKGEHGWSSFGKSRFGIGLVGPLPADYELSPSELADHTSTLVIREREKTKEKTKEEITGPCICGRPSTKFGMVACDGEDCVKGTYHMECMGLRERPDPYYCPDCKERKSKTISRSKSKSRR